METNKETTVQEPVAEKKNSPFADVKLTPEDKEKFFKAYLSDEPYVETVKIFKGKYSYTFRSLTVEESSDIVKQINLDQEKGVAKNNDAYFIQVSAYRAALSITKVNGTPFSDLTKESYKVGEDGNSYVKARADLLYKYPNFKLTNIIDHHNNFERKIGALLESVTSETF